MRERTDAGHFDFERFLTRFHNGEFESGQAAKRLMEEFSAMNLPLEYRYELIRIRNQYLAEGNLPRLTRRQMINWDDFVLASERILEEDGLELPETGRVSDFRLVPLPVGDQK